jgi:D-alanyl-lipoteichoic acid acyltransferase DltB (MBOAT superfamily)
LIFFKYWNWIIESLDSLSSINFSFLKHNYDLPWAISFYTFESLSYIIDIYRRKFKASNSLIEYFTFIAFFPKLVAGPIMRSHELIPQFRQFKKKLSPRNLEFAIFLILWGIFKKIVFADNLGHILLLAKNNIKTPGVGYVIAISGAFYLYCDFSAYCDIARGSAKLLSIKLNRNFLNPFLSKNMSEFFKRWNITLGNWIRDYVYISLGGNKFGKFRSFFNILFTMLLFGIWHGASTQFALYGLYAGFFIIFYNISKLDKILIKIFGNFNGNILAIFIQINIIFLCSLIFFSDNFEEFKTASLSWLSIFEVFTSSIDLNNNLNFNKLFYGSIIFILPIFLTDIIGYRRNREFVDLYVKFTLIKKIFLYILMFYITTNFYFQGGAKFVYFQF